MYIPVLWIIHGVVVVDAGFLLDDLGLGAAAGHRAAQEDVDQQHDAEQHAEGDAQVCQPVGVDVPGGAEPCPHRARLRHEHRRRRCQGVRSLQSINQSNYLFILKHPYFYFFGLHKGPLQF